jgi:hypothetical protein
VEDDNTQTEITTMDVLNTDPKEFDAKCDELVRMYGTRFYTRRDANECILDKYRSGLIKSVGWNLLPVKVVGKGRDWRIVLA